MEPNCDASAYLERLLAETSSSEGLKSPCLNSELNSKRKKHPYHLDLINAQIQTLLMHSPEPANK